MSEVKNIFSLIPKIMAEVEPIAKKRQNTKQGYSFRGIDDIYEALQAVLAKHGVFTTSEIISERSEDRQSNSGGNLIYRVLNIRYRFWAEDGSSVTTDVIGEGMDSGDKASNKAMSVAHKYAFLQIFAIPTTDPKDPENESPEVTSTRNCTSSSFDIHCSHCNSLNTMISRYNQKELYCKDCKKNSPLR